MLLYHLADAALASHIESSGFRDEIGTYKSTGMELDGVFFSATYLDSNEDDPGSVAFSVEADETLLMPYEIIEADSDHRKFSIPARVANTFERRRLSSEETRSVPHVDRSSDPAFPPQ